MKNNGEERNKSDIILIVPPNRSYDRRLPLGVMQISSYLTSKGFDNDILDFKGIKQEEGMKKTDAEELKKKIEGAGGKVNLK